MLFLIKNKTTSVIFQRVFQFILNVYQLKHLNLVKTYFLITDNQILVMGGMSDDSNPKDHFWSYDVENNKWKALPSMPTPRYASAAFEIDNKLYVIGSVLYATFY